MCAVCVQYVCSMCAVCVRYVCSMCAAEVEGVGRWGRDGVVECSLYSANEAQRVISNPCLVYNGKILITLSILLACLMHGRT